MGGIMKCFIRTSFIGFMKESSSLEIRDSILLSSTLVSVTVISKWIHTSLTQNYIHKKDLDISNTYNNNRMVIGNTHNKTGTLERMH